MECIVLIRLKLTKALICDLGFFLIMVYSVSLCSLRSEYMFLILGLAVVLVKKIGKNHPNILPSYLHLSTA